MKSDLVYSLWVARLEMHNFKLSFAYVHGILNNAFILTVSDEHQWLKLMRNSPPSFNL